MVTLAHAHSTQPRCRSSGLPGAALVLLTLASVPSGTLAAPPQELENPAELAPGEAAQIPGLPGQAGAVQAAPGTAGGAPAVGLPSTSGPPSPRPRAAEWVHLPASDDNRDFYLDRKSIHERNGEVEFWDVVIFRRPTQKDETSDRWIKEKRTLRRVNCATHQQTLIRGASFDLEGHLIEAVSLPADAGGPYTTVHEGSIAATELYRACKEIGLDVPAEPVTPWPANPRTGANSP